MESMINYPRFMRLVAASLIALLLLAAQTLAAFTNPFNVANGNLLALDENGSNEITRTYDGLNRLGWPQSSANTGWEHDLSRSLATIPRDVVLAAGASAAFQSVGAVVKTVTTAAKTAGTELSVLRYTQKGETFLRYESANPAFSRVTSGGGVTPGTFAASASDGLVPVAQRSSVYNLGRLLKSCDPMYSRFARRLERR